MRLASIIFEHDEGSELARLREIRPVSEFTRFREGHYWTDTNQ